MMIGIIVAGHGEYATGITSMLELVVGRQENYEFINFIQGESQEDLEDDFDASLEKLKHCDKIAVMTDIAGGSPFKTAVTYAVSDSRLEVITGTNVPMLIELIFGRMSGAGEEKLIEQAIEAGKQQITRFHKEML